MTLKLNSYTIASTAALALGLSACGSGGDSEVAAESRPEARPSVAGIWAGSVTPNGNGSSSSAVSIVMDDGTSMTRLNLWTTASSISALPYLMRGTFCCNEVIDSLVAAAAPLPSITLYIPQVQIGGAVGKDTFTGSIASQSALSSTHSFSFSRNVALYERGLTLSALSGTYSGTLSYPGNGSVINYVVTMNVNSSGAVSGSVSQSSCMIDGQFSIPNTGRNLYRIQNFNVFNCSSGPTFHSSFNRTYEGLGFLTDDPAKPGTANNLLVFYAASGGGFFPVVSLQK